MKRKKMDGPFCTSVDVYCCSPPALLHVECATCQVLLGHGIRTTLMSMTMILVVPATSIGADSDTDTSISINAFFLKIIVCTFPKREHFKVVVVVGTLGKKYN